MTDHHGGDASPPRVALLFGVHAHQPAGNFAEVVDHAQASCYAPFLRTVADYPRFRFAIHVSGPLLEDLARRHPGDIALLAEMARRGQAELVGAGYAEPVLAAIPHRDRCGQVRRLSARIESLFGVRPVGAWLTERVWESSVVPSLADCGIRFALVDDYHVACTGRADDDLDGYFTTEEDGRYLDLFPISEPLRYRFPFSRADEAVRFVEERARPGAPCAAVYFDDIEKFGLWPGTNEWVYGRRWLREFIEGVLASPLIEPSSFADFHARARTRGMVYLPTASYVEMGEWSLPAAAAEHYASIVSDEKASGRYASTRGFVRGGIWRNFLCRYPEANWMHKRMLGLSSRLAGAGDCADSEALHELLYLAQANDAYWHGLFGGLYLPHLRRAVWSSLVELESRLDRIAPRPSVERADVDHDGCDEVLLRNEALQAVVRGDGSAAIRELSSYALRQNFADTLRRHAEHYHRRAGEGAGNDSRHELDDAARARAFRLDADRALLDPDPLSRELFRDAWLDEQDSTDIDDYREPAATTGEARDGLGFVHERSQRRIFKSVVLDDATVRVDYAVRTPRPGTLRVTLDFAMPSCDGYSGRYVVAGEIPGGFGQPLALDRASELVLDDRFLGGSVALRFAPPARVTAAPYHTVSQSERGFEKVMQSATVVVEWSIDATDGGQTSTSQPLTVGIELAVRQDPG